MYTLAVLPVPIEDVAISEIDVPVVDTNPFIPVPITEPTSFSKICFKHHQNNKRQ